MPVPASPPRGSPSRRGARPRLSSSNSTPAAKVDVVQENGTTALPASKPDAARQRTFISCLTIPVQGAIPVPRPDPPTAPANSSSTVNASAADPTASLKRAPRKSKTDALAALHSHAQSALSTPDDADGDADAERIHDPGALDHDPEDGVRVPLYRGPPIAVPPALDLATVKTPRPHSAPAPAIDKDSPRPFGLTECPVYHPTPEQWRDPMRYIREIGDEARSHGMCKIVPPPAWRMPFVTDTEKFRFKTRLQRLNSIEACARAKVNFLEQLYRFHKQQGNPRVSVPTINHRSLDLWLLRKEVHRLGGYEAVTRAKKWADLGRLLGYTGVPGLSTQLKNSYARVIRPYELFCQRVRSSPLLSPSLSGDASISAMLSNGENGATGLGGGVTKAEDSPPGSPLTATSSPLSEPPDESEMKERRSRRKEEDGATPTRKRSALNAHANGNGSPEKEGIAEPHCEVCHKKNHGEEMLLCDGCDCGFHIFCLDPPLSSIPKGQWFCHTCLFGTGGDFGFDEGEEHSLSSFQARDAEFRKLWFTMHPPSSASKDSDKAGSTNGAKHADTDTKMASADEQEDPAAAKARARQRELDRDDPTVNWFADKVRVTERDVELEFWRLVRSQTETVEIEYGADVHSTTHGSGMPTLETHPLDPYARDPWNLNNIPILSDSLLRYIKSDISGMTVPWTYVGMVFSTFCWHNEDHYTYSINYMHWGETKTWYSVPGAAADKFEAAIRSEAPDLFEAQPDLLFQLVTLMNPQRLREAGVDVYACNQRAGEFVVTFPKAYHAGFNHGLNFNEAVNFALPDWLPFGLDCAKRYQEHKKHPVFSHDELLITITQQSQSIQTAIWINDSLKEMVEREMALRQKAIHGDVTSEIVEEVDRPEDQYQCSFCKAFCYLSQITCSCTTKIVCPSHGAMLCKCSSGRILRKRFSDVELEDIQARIAERAAVPSAWRAKFTKLLAESARPALRSLRALLAEGDRISFPLPEMHMLRKCVVRANEWIDAANACLVRKPSRKRPRKSRGRSTADGDDGPERPDRALEDVYALLKEVEDLGFDCPEIGYMRNLANEAEEIKAKARALLDNPPSPRERDAYIQNCERLLLDGSSLNVLVDELVEVEKLVMREQLIKELSEEFDEAHTSLESVRQYVHRARACALGPEFMQRLESLLRAGEQWEARVKDVLNKPQRTLEELDECATPFAGVPVDEELMDHIDKMRTRAREVEKQAKAWLLPEPGIPKPKVQEAMKHVTRAEKEFSIPAVTDLKRTLDFAMDLETRCESVLKNRYVHSDDADVFGTMGQWRVYAREHLTMFSLPNFDKLEKQLAQHTRWLEGLPWYCRQHQQAHGQQILDDVMESTRPEDDLPPNDEYFTCICTAPVRPPAPGDVSDAVQCDHCFARFHGVCAANGGSCPFCDHHHWNGTIHKERSWHFCYLPTILLHAPDVTKHYSQDWKQLEIIVHRVDRLSGVIGQFLSFASQPANQRPEYIPQVRHYMRKLYKIQFAVSPNPEVSFGLDLAGLHRILAVEPAPTRVRKRRRPKFVFGQDIDKDWVDGTRCICRGRTRYLLNYPTVECELCNKKYHGGCVFYPPEGLPTRWMCPLCCLRKNRQYPHSEVRVKHVDNPDPDLYVDTKEMLDTFSKEIIYQRLPPPFTPTLFVELIRFTPGQPDNVTANGTPSASSALSAPPSRAGPSTPHTPHTPHPQLTTNGSSSHPRPIQPIPQMSHSQGHHGHHSHHGHHHGHHHSNTHTPAPPPPPVYEHRSSSSSVSQARSVPPPPPWTSSRWSNAAAAAAPPGSRSHLINPEPLRTEPLRSPLASSPLATPPQASRKRKYTEDGMPSSEDRLQVHVSPILPSPKRHQSSHTPQPAPASMSRSNMGLSPSIAMMLAPVPADIRSPPRASTSSSSSSYSSRTLPPPGSSSRLPEDPHSPHSSRSKPRIKLHYREDDRWGGPSPGGLSPRRSPPIPPHSRP
ncbi:hypothetical protein OBBRIDRAFT_787757 [Obba rivulosa]|uniref:[histone H3]-trimethyl-L-lysine(4) demethylase n=1 Tax=Obba rivulosa TaxID=1052685 RepID=A0A8E2DU92_9APHY|nr:hypothetical protein OBBRIDRAFT_787757 [Obba rivulosa]